MNRCESCRWWGGERKHNDHQPIGRCRVSAPLMTGQTYDQYDMTDKFRVVQRWPAGVWPWTAIDDKCGKFERNSALREPVEASDRLGYNASWQPIETAPRDQTAILVMCDIWPGTKSGRAEECNGHNTYVAEWWPDGAGENPNRGRWVCYMDMVQDPDCPIKPTHWMPLPEPPMKGV